MSFILPILKRSISQAAALLLIQFALSAVNPFPSAAQNVSMIFEFADECDDGFTPEIEFYLKSNPEKLWGTYWLQYFNKPLKTKITCEDESLICFGAWLDGSSWGCGKKCTENSKGACFPCRKTTVSIGLQCNK